MHKRSSCKIGCGDHTHTLSGPCLSNRLHHTTTPQGVRAHELVAKMKYCHLELARLLLDNLRRARAPGESYRLVFEEHSKKAPEWFNSAHHYSAATIRVLSAHRKVLQDLCKPQAWRLEVEETGDVSQQKAEEGSPRPKFSSHEPLEMRWFTTVKMRDAAGAVCLLGERGIEPAIGLLKLSLDPNHLCKDEHAGRFPISEMDPSIDEAIDEVQKSQGRRWDIGDELAQKLKEMLRVAYFVLKERLVQPWPPLLVKLLDEAGELSTYLQPSFIELLKLHFGELIKSPFTTNSSVLFWQKDELRWDVGRILAINPTKIVYKEQVIEDLEPKHVLSHTTAGGRRGTRTQDRGVEQCAVRHPP